MVSVQRIRMSKSSWALPKPSVGRRAQSAKRWLSLSEAASTSRRCYVSERDQADSSRCRCQYEFCYTCLARWRTCKCPLWDERRIVDRPIPANDAPQDAVNLANAVPPVPVAHPNLLPAQPTVRAAQPQPQVPAQPAVQPTSKHKDNGRRKRQRNKKKNNRSHVHKFERYHRSDGHDTTCNRCGFVDRWANGCQGCGLMICRICTKHRL